MLTDDLASILSTIHRHGDFYATGSREIALPGLEIDGIGRISLPLHPVQAEQLIALATPAPYGRGEETLVDTRVRRTWQIPAERVHLSGRSWAHTLDSIVASVASGLGVTEPVQAELYKLLVYDEGSFFVEHRDTEKSPGMFATLVMVLPSVCSGGELVIRHQGHEVCLDLNGSEPSEVSFAAFYADCVHEVKPVTGGYRLTLIYNLLRAQAGPALGFPDHEQESTTIRALLRSWANSPDGEGPEKLLYPLEHAYTSAELAFDTLKGMDAAAAAVLLSATADCDLYLAMISIQESGSAEQCYYQPQGRGYRHRYADDVEDDFEIVEIIERDLTVSDWRSPDRSQATLPILPFFDEELCPPDVFKEVEPDEQYFHEATGNEGASFDRSYRRAALVLWPKLRRLAVFNQAGLQWTLPYLADLASRWREGGDPGLWDEAHTLAGHMLANWSTSYRHSRGVQAGIELLSSLTQLEDLERIEAYLRAVPAMDFYNGMENEALVKAASLLPPGVAAQRIEQIMARHAHRKPGVCANLLVRASAAPGFVSSDPSSLLSPAAMTLVETILGNRLDADPPPSWQHPDPMEPALIEDLLVALTQMGEARLADRFVDHILADTKAFDMDRILLPAILKLTQQVSKSTSVDRLRQAGLAHLRARIAEPLEPPADFTRPYSIACNCAHCTELKRFLEDPIRKEWVFKASQDLRGHVEASIRQGSYDLNMETDKRGRPYGLICTKNQASYEKRVAQRKRDLADFTAM